MPKFNPFRGVRAVERIASSFVTNSLESYSKEELNTILESDKQSFLQIIHPTWTGDSNSKDRYKEVRKNYEHFVDKEWLRQDKPSFYLYQQSYKGQSIRGVIGAIAIDDFLNGKIKKHEETREKRKQLFAEYLSAVNMQAEAVLLTYPEQQRIELLSDREERKKSSFSFVDKAGTEHKLWQITDRMTIKQIKDSLAKLEHLYIADGHHRLGSSALYTQAVRKNSGRYTGLENFNYALALLVSDNQLVIRDYNRLVKDFGNKTKEDFFEHLQEKFKIIPKGEKIYVPSKKHHLCMYLDGMFYALYVEKEFRGKPEGLGELDSYLLEANILKPFFDITDSRTDDRIDFLPGTSDIEGIKRLKEKVDSGKYMVAFASKAVTASDLCNVADLGLKMPPKSTYIEPKLPSGLVILDTKH